MAKNDSKNTKPKKKIRLSSPVVTITMFVIAAALLIGSTVGGTRAALVYQSEYYTSQIEMKNIGVSLVERNGARDKDGNENPWTVVAQRDYASASDGTWDGQEKGVLLSGIVEEGESFKLGKVYNEELAVVNSGTIDQYVRVTLYKYWVEADPENPDGIDTQADQEEVENPTPDETKLPELSSDLIRLNLTLGDKWMLDTLASNWSGYPGRDPITGDIRTDLNGERLVLYYKDILTQGGMTTAFCDTFQVDPDVAVKVTQEKTVETKVENGVPHTYTTITTTYDYDNKQFRLVAEVDAVQTHNAVDAIWSAWGRRVSIGTDGSLTLLQ